MNECDIYSVYKDMTNLPTGLYSFSCPVTALRTHLSRQCLLKQPSSKIWKTLFHTLLINVFLNYIRTVIVGEYNHI